MNEEILRHFNTIAYDTRNNLNLNKIFFSYKNHKELLF